MPRTAPACAFAIAALCLLALPGCLITSNNATSYTGNRVEPGADAGIQLHHTTPEEAVAILGVPTSRVAGDDGETLTWRWTRSKSSEGRVFLIFGGASHTTQDHGFHIAFENGVATRKWRD